MVVRRYGVVTTALVLALVSGGCASGVHRPLPYCSESAERRPINPTQWPGVRNAVTASQPAPPSQRFATASPAAAPMAPPGVPTPYVPPAAPVVVTPAAAPAPAVPVMPPAVEVQPAPTVSPATPVEPAAPASDRWKSIWRPAGSQSSVMPEDNGRVGVCNG